LLIAEGELLPEGDTVFKVAEALRPLLVGRIVRRARVGRGLKIGTGCPVESDGRLTGAEGRRVEGVSPAGKHLWIRFEGGLILRSHLGLHGSWHRYDPGEAWGQPEWRAALVLGTDSDVLVCFGAREVECLREGSFRELDARGRLGPDLLGPEANLEGLAARARELLPPGALLVDVLLDQRVAAGIGNVYKSEILFLECQHPSLELGEVSDETLERLFRGARELLRRNVRRGRRRTRFEQDGRGALWVYGRKGEPCLRCAAPIRSARLGAGRRSTYWCPACQPAPAGGVTPQSSGV
jgi:endonuclease VIII